MKLSDYRKLIICEICETASVSRSGQSVSQFNKCNRGTEKIEKRPPNRHKCRIYQRLRVSKYRIGTPFF
jgi:hypothetical protein